MCQIISLFSHFRKKKRSVVGAASAKKKPHNLVSSKPDSTESKSALDTEIETLTEFFIGVEDELLSLIGVMTSFLLEAGPQFVTAVQSSADAVHCGDEDYLKPSMAVLLRSHSDTSRRESSPDLMEACVVRVGQSDVEVLLADSSVHIVPRNALLFVRRPIFPIQPLSDLPLAAFSRIRNISSSELVGESKLSTSEVRVEDSLTSSQQQTDSYSFVAGSGQCTTAHLLRLLLYLTSPTTTTRLGKYALEDKMKTFGLFLAERIVSILLSLIVKLARVAKEQTSKSMFNQILTQIHATVSSEAKLDTVSSWKEFCGSVRGLLNVMGVHDNQPKVNEVAVASDLTR